MNGMISVIVPIYKSELWLDKCISSILNQSYKNLEIILVDDGSPDNSGKICDRYSELDKRVKVIHQKNMGVSVARNSGLANSNGEYILFVDSDDWIEENMCELLINNIINKKSDLVVCGLNITKNGRILRKPTLVDDTFIIRSSEELYWNLRKINLGPCNKLYKKLFIKKGFDISKSLGEDTIFVLEYMKNIKTITTINNCLYNVRLDNEESLNRKIRDDKLELVLNLLKTEEKYYKDMYGENYKKEFIYNEYILTFHSCFRDSVSNKNKSEAIKYMNKYLKAYKKDIVFWSKKSNLLRKDYVIFNFLIRLGTCNLIYSFFKIKLFITKK